MMNLKNNHNDQLINKYLAIQSASVPGFSPDGKNLAFIMNMSGVAQIWMCEHHPGSKDILWPEQKTFSRERVTGYWYSPSNTGDFLYASDRGGDERTQLYLYEEQKGETTCLTEGFEKAMHGFGDWSQDGNTILFHCNRRHPGYFDLYKQDLHGSPELIWQNDSYGLISFVSLSPDGKKAVFNRIQSTFNHDLFEVDIESRTARSIAPTSQETSYARAAFLPDGKTLLLSTDMGGEYLYLGLLDLESLTLKPLISLDHDIDHFVLSHDGRFVAYFVNTDGSHELCLYDMSDGSVKKAPLPGETPGVAGEVSPYLLKQGLCFSPDLKYVAFTYTTPLSNPNVYLWDVAADEIYPVTKASMGGLKPQEMRTPELVSYPTFDGRQIPGLLYKPEPQFPKPWPVVVIVHGGPAGQSRMVFHFFAQMLLRNGFAVFLPNVRGSKGYGKTYTQLDEVEKRMDSVADLAHGALWLKSQPEFDGNKLGVYGASYGGFMVLASLTHYPDLWAVGVDLVGQTNFVTFLENTSEYRRAHREAEYGSLAKDRAFLESFAPINHLDKVKAPLMVVHGENDPRVPVSETLSLVSALEDRKIPVEKIIFSDEGHGISKDKNKRIAYPAILDFFKRHLF